MPAPSTDAPTVVWFRRDLRLADQPALTVACDAPGGIIALYVLDDETPGAWKAGGASRWWLHRSLERLTAGLARHGVPLILRRGAAREVVPEVARVAQAGSVLTLRGYEPWAEALERDLRRQLDADGITFRRYAGNLLFEPEAVRTRAGEAFKVYTPFWRAAITLEAPRTSLPAPGAIRAAARQPKSLRLSALGLLPRKPDWSGGLADNWEPGEAGAERRLAAFLDTALAGYKTRRDRPDLPATSRLSPHLAFGEISPARCWHAARAHATLEPAGEAGLETFLKELVWREFSYHLLAQRPDLPEVPFRPEFAAFPWSADARALAAWQRGRTGYPIVDAGMRELWHTGWMHNRVRMIAASFLVKDLLIPWQEGERWFWDTLVDADIASNAASWQWVAGSGADAAPYFRIFNPVKQGETFDPAGHYVRRWIPEIARLPDEHLHAPWLAPADVLAAAGVRAGETYPLPIVDHGKARAAALAAYARIKAGSGH